MASLEEALYGLNYTPAQTGYGMASQAIGQATPQLINPYGSTGQAIGIGLGSILLQSLLGYQARSQAAQDTLQANTLANQMMSMETPQARTDFIAGIDDSMQQARLSTLATALTGQERARQTKAAEKLLDLETAAKFELGPLGTQIAERKQQQEIELARARVRGLTSALGGETAATVGALPPLEGGTALQAKRDALIARGIELGMTPGQAAQYAEKNLTLETGATKDAQKRIDKSRERANALEQISSTARAGLEGAGMTGGALGGLREALSSGYAVVSPKEQEKRDYQKLLDSVRPQVVQMLRSPGAVSDFETKLLMGAGPSSTNTPSENAKIIQGMETIANLEADYADFVESLVRKQGSSVGADALWRQYKSEQVFPEGKYNPLRTDWASWLSERGMATESAIVGPNVAGSNSIAALQARLDALDRKEAELKVRKGIK